MKKSVIFFCGLFLALSGYLYASDVSTESVISKVIIYPGSAMVERTASLKLSAGEHKVNFSDIIPEVDENTLRVSGNGNAEVKLFGAKVKREYLQEEPAERIKQINQEIEKLKDEGRNLNAQKMILSDEKNLLDSIRLFSNQQLPKDLVTKIPATKDLDDLLKFLDVKLKENYSQVLDCEIKIRELIQKIDVLTRELNNISGPSRKLKRSVEVGIQVLKPGNLDLSISYLVGGASWQPVYDARASFEKSEVILDSYGLVKQSTGEDWQNVEVSLSTARPAVGGNLPYVSPWILRPYQPPQEMYKERRMPMKSKADLGMQYAAFSDEEAVGSAEPEYAVAEEKGVSVVYTLPRKETVKSDGSEYKLAISSQVLKANFQYSTYPRVSTFAYLGSRVANAKGLQLLGGRVNIFTEGDFIGSSNIENIGPGEEFDLYLGADENVKVKREQIEKKVDETLVAGIPSPNKQIIYRYKLTVENYKSKKISVKLFEAMPVSEDDRIKVKIDKVSLEPKEKNWKDRKGVWLWELDLEPKAKQEIFFTLVIEHPRQMEVEGLQ